MYVKTAPVPPEPEADRCWLGFIVMKAILGLLLVLTVQFGETKEIDPEEPIPTDTRHVAAPSVEKLDKIYFEDLNGKEWVTPAWFDPALGGYLVFRPNPHKRSETLVALIGDDAHGVLKSDWQSVAGKPIGVRLAEKNGATEAEFTANGVAWRLHTYITNASLDPVMTANPADPAGEVPHTHM